MTTQRLTAEFYLLFIHNYVDEDLGHEGNEPSFGLGFVYLKKLTYLFITYRLTQKLYIFFFFFHV